MEYRVNLYVLRDDQTWDEGHNVIVEASGDVEARELAMEKLSFDMVNDSSVVDVGVYSLWPNE